MEGFSSYFKKKVPSVLVWLILVASSIVLFFLIKPHSFSTSPQVEFISRDQYFRAVKSKMGKDKEVAMTINGNNILWEEVREIVEFDAYLATPPLGSLQAEGGYENNIEKRLIHRILLETLAGEYNLDYKVTSEERTRFLKLFLMADSELIRKERDRRLRSVALRERLTGNQEEYTFDLFLVSVNRRGADILEKQGEDVYKISKQKAQELCAFTKSTDSYEDITSFIEQDGTILLLNGGSNIISFKQSTAHDIKTFSLGIFKEVENLSVGEQGDVKLFRGTDLYNENKTEDQGYGCVNLRSKKEGRVGDWRAEFDQMEVKIHSNIDL